MVALQELDVKRSRSGLVHQVEEIAHELDMNFHFHPALEAQGEQYGDAIFSRLPMRLIKAAALPGLELNPSLEPRGALWVEISAAEQKIQIINTHLGLRPAEKRLQIEALLGPDWLRHPSCTAPALLLGDFNALPRSFVWRATVRALKDTQQASAARRPQRTYPSRFRLGRIDHVFATANMKVLGVEAPSTTLTRTASDHLPLIVEFEL